MLTQEHLVTNLDFDLLPRTAEALAVHPDYQPYVAGNPTTPQQLLLAIANSIRKAPVHIDIVSRPLHGDLRSFYLTKEKRAGVLTQLTHFNELSDDEIAALFERGAVTGKVLDRIVHVYGYRPQFAELVTAGTGKHRLISLAHYDEQVLTDTARAAALADGESWLGRPFTNMGIAVKAALEFGPKTRAAAIAPMQNAAIVASAAAHRAYSLDEQLLSARLTVDGDITADGQAQLERYAQTVVDRNKGAISSPDPRFGIADQFVPAWTALIHSPWTYPQVLDAIETAARCARASASSNPSELFQLLDQLEGRRRWKGSERIEPDPATWDETALRWIVRRSGSYKRFAEIDMVSRATGLTAGDVYSLLEAFCSEEVSFWHRRSTATFERLAQIAEIDDWTTHLPADPRRGRISDPETLPYDRSPDAPLANPELLDKSLSTHYTPFGQNAAVAAIQRKVGDRPGAWFTALSLLPDMGQLNVDQFTDSVLALAPQDE